MQVSLLPAFNGDSILIEDRKGFQNVNILIDGGISRTYPQKLKGILEKKYAKSECIDLLIITHVDDDHIGGIIKLFEDSDIEKSIIKNVWFNSGEKLSSFFGSPIKKSREISIIPDSTLKMSIKDGITLESELKKFKLWNSDLIRSGDSATIGNISIKILSPDITQLEKLNKRWVREVTKNLKMSDPSSTNYSKPLKKLISRSFTRDNSIPNGSSIAILLEVDNKNFLFLGDSHQSTIINSLKKLGYSKNNPLKAELIKLSHHGSKRNTGYELLEIVDCKKYAICTDGSTHNLPNKEVFARILEIHNNSNFYFNYKNDITTNIFSYQDTVDYSFKCNYVEESDFQIFI